MSNADASGRRDVKSSFGCYGLGTGRKSKKVRRKKKEKSSLHLILACIEFAFSTSIYFTLRFHRLSVVTGKHVTGHLQS